MAKQSKNIIMRSTRGMLGKQIVFKERAGESYVSAAPGPRKNKPLTTEQEAVQEKFSRCVNYASTALKNADTKKAYAAKATRKQTAYNVAFSDAFFAPKVLGMITTGYTGEMGQQIIVQAQDDFKVKAVKITIHNAANELIETGEAIENADGLNWVYTATQANANLAGTKIVAIATDLPGNEGSMETVL